MGSEAVVKRSMNQIIESPTEAEIMDAREVLASEIRSARTALHNAQQQSSYMGTGPGHEALGALEFMSVLALGALGLPIGMYTGDAGLELRCCGFWMPVPDVLKIARAEPPVSPTTPTKPKD